MLLVESPRDLRGNRPDRPDVSWNTMTVAATSATVAKNCHRCFWEPPCHRWEGGSQMREDGLSERIAGPQRGSTMSISEASIGASPLGRGPTIRDVAALSGVAASTVSRALTQPHRVNQATRERIEAAAREL